MRSLGLHNRIRDWISRLETSSVQALPASRLYAGDHWTVVLGIPAAAAGELKIKMWVASAGYGLVSIDTPLKPYSATFIRAHEEAIAPAGSDYSPGDWWRELGQWRPTRYEYPRTLAQLAATFTSDRDVLLLAMSEPYALALREDIDAAEATAPDRVALVSVGLASTGGTNTPESLLPVEARLKQRVGGAMQGVNGRIAELIVRERAAWYPRVKDLRELIRAKVASTPALPTFDRAVQTDDEVRQFIHECISTRVASSKSAALRALRDSGRACEQARFGRLFREVTNGSSTTSSEAGELE